MTTIPAATLAQLIDHTLLRADAAEADIRKLCEEALAHGFYSVCVNSRWIPFASQLLRNAPGTTRSPLAVAVVGFPLGATLTRAKAFEATEAVHAGAGEIDMVLDLGAVKSGQWSAAESDIRAVVEACEGRPLKVILETGFLNDTEIQRACEAAVRAGARFVKTSTGFGPGGATAEHIALMRSVVGPQLGVKASGGIRDFATAQRMIDAGANRLGCSASIAIVSGATPTPSTGGY